MAPGMRDRVKKLGCHFFLAISPSTRLPHELYLQAMPHPALGSARQVGIESNEMN